MRRSPCRYSPGMILAMPPRLRFRSPTGRRRSPGRSRACRIGVPRTFVAEGVDDDVRQAFDVALDTLKEAGAVLVDIELPHAKYAIPVYYLVCTAEASSNLARYDGIKYGRRATASDDTGLRTMYARTRDAVSVPRSSDASCSGPMSSARGTTTPIT